VTLLDVIQVLANRMQTQMVTAMLSLKHVMATSAYLLWLIHMVTDGTETFGHQVINLQHFQVEQMDQHCSALTWLLLTHIHVMVVHGRVKFHGALIVLMAHLFKVAHLLKVASVTAIQLFTAVQMQAHVTTTQTQLTMMAHAIMVTVMVTVMVTL
jgi:hypothetical protein